MDPLTATAASGLRSRLEALDLLANNLANSTTAGYKSDREFYGVYRAAEAENNPAAMPDIERNWTDFSQGIVSSTGNPLDLALTGPGFFAVDGPAGPLYTRNGGFRLSAAGRVTTAEGYPVRAVAGAALALDPARPIEIAPDGAVRQAGQAAGQLELVDFTGTAALAKQGHTYFRNLDPAVQPRPAAATVEQGRLEGSNTGSAAPAVRLVNVMRQFEMLNKAIAIGGDMNRRAVEEVARVNG